MDDDKKYNENNQETEINNFSNRNVYNPLGTEDEGQVNSNYYSNGDYDSNNFKRDDDNTRNIVREEIIKNKPKFPWLRTIAIALLFSVLSSGITALVMKGSLEKTSGASKNGTNSNYTINTKDEVNTENAVAAKVIPSVVGIQTANKTNDIFSQERYVEGVGSGVVVSEDGYILTNSHVISNGQADAIQVVFSDKETIEGKVVWYDESLDLAIVKVEKNGLTTVEMGDSDKVAVGDKAIAIGNPLGLDLQSTLTSGYISGLNRSITLETQSTMDGLIQTDAAINGGNSGGALLNSKGELIGINTAKASAGEGIGFAIPINTAKSIVDGIKENGSFQPVLLGIQGTELEYYEKSFKIDTGAENGAVVMKVEDGSPAAKAGIEVGDVITEINSKKIDGMNNLRKLLLDYKVGDTVEVKIIRNGKEKKIDLKFEDFKISEKETEPQDNSQDNLVPNSGDERKNIFNLPFGE